MDSALTADGFADIASPPRAGSAPMVAARLAAALVRPLSEAGDDAAGMPGGAKAAALRALARHRAFAAPLDRAAAGLAGLGDIVLDERALRRIGRSEASDCALQLATAAAGLLERAALHLGAIVLHRRLLGVALKRERDALERMLGGDTCRLATREAPVLHAILADLDDGSLVLALGDDARERQTARGIAAVGRRALHGFVARTEPSLTPLLALRCPPPPGSGEPPAAMTGRHDAHIVKLLHRRFGPWPRVTG